MSNQPEKPVVGEVKAGPRLLASASGFFSRAAKKLKLSKLPKSVKILLLLLLVLVVIGGTYGMHVQKKKLSEQVAPPAEVKASQPTGPAPKSEKSKGPQPNGTIQVNPNVGPDGKPIKPKPARGG